MDIAARLALAVVLLGAAAAKLRSPRDLPEILGGYGIPRRLRVPAAAALVAAEALLGLALVAGVAATTAAWAALALGVVFIAALARARLRGATRLRCGCFGTRERPIAFLLTRAFAYTLLAGLTVAALELDPGRPTGGTVIVVALIALAAAVAVLAVLVLALYRQVGVLTMRLGPQAPLELEEEGPAVGEPAPPLAPLARRGTELVAFFSEDCRICRELAPSVAALAREGLRVHVLYERAAADAFGDWRIPGTPFFVQVIDGGVVAKGLVNTLEQLDHLLAIGRARREHAAA